MSPSKKANKQVTKKTRSAQATPARSPHASSKKNTKAGKDTRRGKSSPKTKSTEKSNTPSVKIEAQSNDALRKQMASAATPKTSLSTNLLRIISLLAVVGITIYIYNIREHVAEFERFGYAGIFVIALLANATVLLPAPGVAIVYAMGAVFNPIGVGLAAGTGGALGELSGYLAGFSGQAVIERTDIYERFKPWVDKYGGWAIFLLSAIPNPFFDVAGIAAGIAKMPIGIFLVFTWAGQIVKMTAFAVAGYYSLEWLSKFMG